RRNKPVHGHRAPADLGENVVHLLNARNALKGDAGIEQALKINFVSVFFKEENILPHDEAPDGVIHGRVIIVALIDGELQKMLWCGSDRRIIEADTAGSFHWHPPLRIKYDSFAERARGLGIGNSPERSPVRGFSFACGRLRSVAPTCSCMHDSSHDPNY